MPYSGVLTVAVPQLEMGQGVTTLLPQVVAMELGADWRTVAVEPAPISPLYANSFLAEEVWWAFDPDQHLDIPREGRLGEVRGADDSAHAGRAIGQIQLRMEGLAESGVENADIEAKLPGRAQRRGAAPSAGPLMTYDPIAGQSSDERVLSVTQLNEVLKEVLESCFPTVWVSGEISNFSRPQSGHCYLTLKDDRSQVRAVIWRTTASRVP